MWRRGGVGVCTRDWISRPVLAWWMRPGSPFIKLFRILITFSCLSLCANEMCIIIIITSVLLEQSTTIQRSSANKPVNHWSLPSALIRDILTDSGPWSVTSAVTADLPMTFPVTSDLCASCCDLCDFPVISAVTSDLPVTSAVTSDIPVTSVVTSGLPVTSAVTSGLPVTHAVTSDIPVTSAVTSDISVTPRCDLWPPRDLRCDLWPRRDPRCDLWPRCDL